MIICPYCGKQTVLSASDENEDKKRLEELGFIVDVEYGGDGFGSFKYGSC